VKESTPPLCNGDFETGDFSPYWTHGGELGQSVTASISQSGDYSALLGDPDRPCDQALIGTAWLSQSIAVPPTGEPRLSFWYRIMTYDAVWEDLFDRFEVYLNGNMILRDGSTGPDYGCDKPVNDLGWREFSYDLGGYRGQTIQLKLENISWPDRWYNTWTYVDDVSLTP